MGLTVAQPTPSNSKDHCFEPLKKRNQIDFQPHEGKKWHLQIYHSNSQKDWEVAQLKQKLKRRSLTQEELDVYTDRKKLIKNKKEEIEGHLDRRIQLFFQQAILCYNTPFVYDAEGAEDQIGVGSKLEIKEKKHQTQAAHSSVLPCLYAHLKNSQGEKDPNSRFVFLKYSHAYHQHNSTVELPIEVNQADTELDGKIGQPKLRDAAIKIINQTALGKINPTEATKRFLSVSEERLARMLREMDKTDLRRKVLKIYLLYLQEVSKAIKESPTIFDQIMGVKLPKDGKILRNVVYKNRYALIQQAEFIDSRIKKKIFEAQASMLGKKAESLKSVDYRLRYTLLKTSNNQERRFFEKLFCTSIEQLRTGLKEHDPIRGVEKFQKTHELKIKNLARDLRALRRELQKLEFEFRAKLFKGLRVDFKKWYQKEFAEHFKALYPQEAMSQSMVSRLEQLSRLPRKFFYATPENQRQKKMDIGKAQKIAHTFGIDVGLFLPSLIASEY